MSRLVAIDIQNVMTIPEARIEIGDDNIISLVGYNDVGKSAIIRALEVVFYDAHRSNQVNLITDDEDEMGIGLEFDDGININRYKYRNGKSVWEMFQGDKMLYTNRLTHEIAVTNGVPDPIAKYLNVLQDEDKLGAALNIRRATDKLLLINTSGGENYSLLSEILQTDVLASASKMVIKDRLVLQKQALGETAVIGTLKADYANMHVMSEEQTKFFHTKQQELKDLREQFAVLSSLISQREELATYYIYDEVPFVDLTAFADIMDIIEKREIMNISIPAEVTEIDVQPYMDIIQVIHDRESSNISIPTEVTLVDTTQFEDIRDIVVALNGKYDIDDAIEANKAEYDKIHNELHTLSEQHGFKLCENCGSLVH